MLARVSNFRPGETIFEIGQRGHNKSEAATMMRARRTKITTDPTKRATAYESDSSDSDASIAGNDSDIGNDSDVNMSAASDNELENTFTPAPLPKPKKKKTKTWEDAEHFMSYAPSTSLAEDRGYSLGNSTSFTEAARSAPRRKRNSKLSLA